MVVKRVCSSCVASTKADSAATRLYDHRLLNYIGGPEGYRDSRSGVCRGVCRPNKWLGHRKGSVTQPRIVSHFGKFPAADASHEVIPFGVRQLNRVFIFADGNPIIGNLDGETGRSRTTEALASSLC